jgi:sulfite reductase (NADPH) flavoprotein alpha-component
MAASTNAPRRPCGSWRLEEADANPGDAVIDARAMSALAVLLLYALLCAAVWRAHLGRIRAARHQASSLAAPAGVSPVLVLHASQTGTAEHTAWSTAQALHTAGVPVRLASLGEVDRTALRSASRALIVVSTCGEGDPPDAAASFVRQVMGGVDQQDLTGLHVGLLAFGDRSYLRFCGFARELDAWLLRQGAARLFPRIEVDKGDPQALQHWRHQLGHLAGTRDLLDWEPRRFDRWQLSARRHLNPGGIGGALFHVELVPAGGQPLPHWEAGDLAQLRLPDEPGRPREYSIASLPADGCVLLLVRQSGRASRWLTETLAIGASVELRLQAHPSFRITPNETRPLILIGNGTGLAGLLGHLKARAGVAFPPPVWLVHGERQAAHDTHCAAEIDTWQRAGWLRHVDRVFSRDQAERRHVQHLLSAEGRRLRTWVDDGAAIYVCGSLEGMARGVEDTLVAVLGEDTLALLDAQRRYRRDVY